MVLRVPEKVSEATEPEPHRNMCTYLFVCYHKISLLGGARADPMEKMNQKMKVPLVPEKTKYMIILYDSEKYIHITYHISYIIIYIYK